MFGLASTRFASGLIHIMLCACIAWSRQARAQETDHGLFGISVGGTITAAAILGDTLYVGGSFIGVSRVLGGGAVTNAVTGVLQPRSPSVAGTVWACIPDGRQGWFIGGEFAGVGGLPRSNLAHIFGDGRVDAWAPNTDGVVRALALSGRTLYVGGYFTKIGGELRNSVAAIDIDTGKARAWNPDVPDYVTALLVHGSSVYLGGWFEMVGGQPRSFLAAVEKETGEVLPWNPAPNDGVMSLAANGDTVFAGGRFDAVGGSVRTRLAAFDAKSGSLLDWNVTIDRVPYYRYDCGPCVWKLVVDGRRLYLAGGFNRVAGAVRPALAAVDVGTGEVLDWDPQVLDDPNLTPAWGNDVVVSGTAVYAVGHLRTLGGFPCLIAGALDRRTAERLPWDPQPNSGTYAIGVGERGIFIGGAFTSLGPDIPRSGLAAFDLRTGEVTSWNPAPDGHVRAMAARDSTVYVGGQFGFIGGLPRPGLAAVHGRTGKATPWNPTLNLGSFGSVWTLAIGDASLYAGGLADAFGPGFLREWDLETGLLTSWDPNPNDLVAGLLVDRDVVYAGGLFTAIGAAGRSRVAAVDRSTGRATPWDPQANDMVNCFALKDTTVYVGGYFNSIGGQLRDAFAAISARSGQATDLIANVDQQVKQIVVRDGVIYVAGAFRSIGGVPRFCLAALESGTGKVLDWNPDPDGVVWGMTANEFRVFPLGRFSRMGTKPVSGLAALPYADGGPGPPTAARPFLTFVGVTNPCRSSGVVHFDLRGDALVDLDVYDMQGRRVRRLLNRAPKAAGTHQLPVNTSGWPPGFYFYRLAAGSTKATRKMVVLP